MSNTSQETGNLSINEAMNSLLATPPVTDTESEGRLEREENTAQPTEAEAEVIEEDTLEEEPSDDEYEDDADEVEELDEDDSSEEFEEEPVYTVAVDGEERQVTLEELQKGYSRQQVYTKRSQELAEQRKAFEAEAQQVAQMRDAYAQQLEQLSEQLQQVNDQEPDWSELAKQYSAEELFVYKAQLDKQKEQARQVEAERQAIAQQQAQEQQAQMQKHLAEQREEMLNRIPQWRDEDVRTSEREQVIKYAQQSVGFSPQEIASASDARAIELLYKAWQWDNLQSKKPAAKKKASKAPKMAKAGQPKTKAQVASRQRRQSLQRLNNERSVDAAVNYLMGN